MPFQSKVEVANVELSDQGPHWLTLGAGYVFAGTPFDRPRMIVRDFGYPSGLKMPYYASPFGKSGGGDASITVTMSSGVIPANTVIRVREVFRNILTGRSNPGKVFEFTSEPNQNADFSFTITSNSVALKSLSSTGASTNEAVDLREFYVEYVDLSAGYKLATQVIYTGGGDTSPSVNWTPEEIVDFRPLESGLENSIFPAVASLEYWKGRLWGGGQRSRGPLTSSLAMTEDSELVVLSGDCKFTDGDTYKAIKYVGDGTVSFGGGYIIYGQTLGYIDTVLNESHALVRWDGYIGSPDGTTWPYADLTLSNGSTSSDTDFIFAPQSDADVFYSPVYIGEASQGLTYGILSWSPLNVFRDDILWQTCGRVQFVKRVGEDLVIVYERGCTVIYGDFSVGQPAEVKSFPASHEVGTFNPYTVWLDSQRRLIFVGYGRFYAISGTVIVDITHTMASAGWLSENISSTVGATEDATLSYNASRNSTLIAGLTKTGDVSAGTLGLYICHDRTPDSLHPLRLPDKFTSMLAVPAEIGGQQFRQWYCGAADGKVYLGMPPGLNNDDGDPIAWSVTTGIRFKNWLWMVLKSVLVLFRGGGSEGMTATTSIAATNVLDDTTDVVTALERTELELEYANLTEVECRAFRLTLSGHNDGEEFKIHRAHVRWDNSQDRSG